MFRTYPSSSCMSRAMLSTHCVPKEVLRNRQAEEERDAGNEEVAHRVHVSEL